MRISIAFLLMVCTACGSQGPATDPATGDTLAPGVPTADTAQRNNTLSKAEADSGWILLFDGSSKKGWHVYQSKSDGSAWKVEQGMLMLDPREKKDWQTIGGGDLITDAAYSNYHFAVDWKISPKGNSGIIFGIQDEPAFEHSWHTGMEMQVLDNAGHDDASHPKHRAGDLYDLIASNPETVRPAGEWNQAEIIMNQGKLDLYLNGTKVVSSTLGDDAWKALVNGSKFKEWPQFARFSKGHIGLQDHGDPVWYRNIRIRPL